MAVAVNSAFERGYAGALDADSVVADITARNAIIAGKRHLGMSVHVIDSDGAGTAMNYQLVGGILDANWIEFAGGGSGGFAEWSDDTQVGTIVIPEPTTKYIRVNGDGATPITIDGIDVPDEINEVTLFNFSGARLTIADSANADPLVWIVLTPPGYSLVLEQGTGASFAYDPVDECWYLTGLTDTSTIHDQQIAIGEGAGDVDIIARTGATPYTTPPMLKYNDATSKWTFSNDGVVFIPFGSGELVIQEVVGNYTVLVTDDVVFVDATLGNVIISLPTSVGWKKPIRIKKMDNSANTVAIAPDGSETIDGESSRVIYDQYHSATLFSDNANWSIF